MYISKIKIDSFRNFKSQEIEFREGVNVIIGHNNAGKSNLLRAISLVLDSNRTRRLDVDDFHKNITFNELKANPPKISIQLTISKGEKEEPDDLTTIGNWLTKLDASYEAQLTYEFFLPEQEREKYKEELERITETNDVKAKELAWKTIRRNFIRLYTYKIFGGDLKNRNQAEAESLQKFDFQFLDAIRDVERDMLTGRNTLLRNVFQFFLDYDLKADINSQDNDEQLRRKDEIRARQEKFEGITNRAISELQERMSGGKDQILSYAKDTGASFNNAEPDFDGCISEIDMLSSLQLIIKYTTGIDITIPATHNGLGYNNLIFMSLLLAKMQVDADGAYMGSNAKVFATLAIEEPEAHLHPAMQYKFLKFLKEGKNTARQIFVTTHSTHITAAVSLDEIICLHQENGVTHVGYPRLVFPPDNKSKKYAQRFLDATKSDMLFAQKVILVEGLAEQLLLSIFAKYYDLERQEIPLEAGVVYHPVNLEDNHVAVINVGGRYFNHFLYLFNSQEKNTINKKIACLTDRDPVRKPRSDSKFMKCYTFETNQDTSSYEYSNHASLLIDSYNNHPNIRFFSQDQLKGKTFEYDLVTFNPTFKGLVTESTSNRDEINELMGWFEDTTKTVTDLLNILPKGSVESPNTQNVRIKEGINTCNWLADEDKKKAIIASRYLSSVGKGENALELAFVLEENLDNYGKESYIPFEVPTYIKEAIDWICK